MLVMPSTDDVRWTGVRLVVPSTGVVLCPLDWCEVGGALYRRCPLHWCDVSGALYRRCPLIGMS